ncbi:hypothetical protein ABH926_005395 [Catenulispora sp. GP43]
MPGPVGSTQDAVRASRVRPPREPPLTPTGSATKTSGALATPVDGTGRSWQDDRDPTSEFRIAEARSAQVQRSMCQVLAPPARPGPTRPTRGDPRQPTQPHRRGRTRRLARRDRRTPRQPGRRRSETRSNRCSRQRGQWAPWNTGRRHHANNCRPRRTGRPRKVASIRAAGRAILCSARTDHRPTADHRARHPSTRPTRRHRLRVPTRRLTCLDDTIGRRKVFRAVPRPSRSSHWFAWLRTDDLKGLYHRALRWASMLSADAARQHIWTAPTWLVLTVAAIAYAWWAKYLPVRGLREDARGAHLPGFASPAPAGHVVSRVARLERRGRGASHRLG